MSTKKPSLANTSEPIVGSSILIASSTMLCRYISDLLTSAASDAGPDTVRGDDCRMSTVVGFGRVSIESLGPPGPESVAALQTTQTYLSLLLI